MIPKDILDEILNDVQIDANEIDEIESFVKSFGDEDLNNLLACILQEKGK